MNAFQLRQYLNDLEGNGQNLEDLPILFIEGVRHLIAKQATQKDINIVNVKRFNEQSDTLFLQTQFENAMVIGPIIECD